jgi:hypothetical protein
MPLNAILITLKDCMKICLPCVKNAGGGGGGGYCFQRKWGFVHTGAILFPRGSKGKLLHG